MMDLNKVAGIAKKIGENTKAIVSVQDAVTGETVFSEPQDNNVSQQKISSLMESAVSSSFNSPQELKAKKALAAALLIAKKKKMLPAGVSPAIDAISSAAMSDETLTKMKTAYQVSTGKIDVYKASDIMIDHATARVVAVADKMVEKGVAVAIDKIGVAVVSAFPPALPVVIMLKSLQPLITKKAQQLVRKGIRKIGEEAKKTVRKIGAAIKTTVTNVGRRFAASFL